MHPKYYVRRGANNFAATPEDIRASVRRWTRRLSRASRRYRGATLSRNVLRATSFDRQPCSPRDHPLGLLVEFPVEASGQRTPWKAAHHLATATRYPQID